jgi:hypothetical protein
MVVGLALFHLGIVFGSFIFSAGFGDFFGDSAAAAPLTGAPSHSTIVFNPLHERSEEECGIDK